MFRRALSRADVLTLLHKVGQTVPSTRNADFWEARLARAHQDLSAATERPVNVVVAGPGGKELVAALLADPWSSQTSSYLQQFPLPVEIKVLPEDVQADSAQLYDADIPIICWNPLTTSLSSLLKTRLPTHSILVCSGMSQPSLQSVLEKQPSPVDHIASDPHRAIQAVRILKDNPTSPSAIQRYQDEFIGSNVSSITRIIKERMTPIAPTLSSLSSLQLRSALATIQDALAASMASARTSQNSLDKAYLDISRLRERIEEVQARVPLEIIQPREPTSDDKPQNTVKASLANSSKYFGEVLEYMTWSKIFFKIDGVANLMGDKVGAKWCTDLEKELILHSGRLSVVQQEVTDAAFKLLDDHPKIPSAILRNKMRQLTNNATYPISTCSLSQVVVDRRKQIIAYPTVRLHMVGARSVVGTVVAAFAGAATTWTGWFEMYTGAGLPGILTSLDGSTLIAAGWLIDLAALRWGIGYWAKGKRLWKEDCDRIGDGLERDLNDKIQTVTKNQVVTVAETACEELSKIIKEYDEELVKTVNDVKVLQSALDDIVNKGGE